MSDVLRYVSGKWLPLKDIPVEPTETKPIIRYEEALAIFRSTGRKCRPEDPMYAGWLDPRIFVVKEVFDMNFLIEPEKPIILEGECTESESSYLFDEATRIALRGKRWKYRFEEIK